LQAQGTSSFPSIYQQSTLPYTTLVAFGNDSVAYADPAPFFHDRYGGMSGETNRLALAPFEVRFFRLDRPT
jgi:hypothetical protein